jgi:hypothetical protein
MADKKPTEKNREEPNGTTLTVEEWIEEMNTCDRLHKYVKRRKEESEKPLRGEKRQALSRPQN